MISSPRSRRPLAYVLLAVGLFLVALVLRVWLSSGSLPYVEHIDEPAVLEVAIRMVRDGDFNPHTFRYPSLYYYLLAATTRLHIWWGLAAGLYSSDQDIPFKNYGFTSVPDLFIWGRNLTALLGAATIPALLVLGQRMFNLRTGLLAALWLTLMSYHVRHSDVITVDAATSLWVTLAVLGAWEVARGGIWPAYLLAGAAAGLAAGTKYNAGVVVVAIGLAHVIHWRRGSLGRPLMRLAGAAAASLLVFLAATPFSVLDSAAFLRDLGFNAYHYSLGDHGDFVGRWPWANYAWFFWDESLRAPAVVVLLAGLPILAWRFSAQVALLLSVIAATMLMLLSYSVHFSRNTLPVIPLLALLIAGGAVALTDLIPRSRLRTAALMAIGAVLLLPQAYATYTRLDYWGRPHSMVEAAGRLKELPQGARIAAEIPSTLFGGEAAIFPVRRITEHTLEWYRANGFRYLAVNDDLRTPEDRAAYEHIREAATVVAAYAPRKAGVQPGPSGAILDLGVRPDLMAFVRRELQFGDTLRLLGYEIQPGEPRARIEPLAQADLRDLAPGQPVQLNLYWQALAPMGLDYVMFVHILDEQGQLVAQRDLAVRYDDYMTSRWQVGELVIDRADMPLPALPPGTYRLVIGLYDPASGARLPVNGPEEPLLTLRVR